VTFTATVQPDGSGTPTGSVQFQIDGSNFGSPVELTGGSATSAAISALAVCGHQVTALYSGDGNFTPSSASLSEAVSQDATTTTLSASASPAGFGQSITLAAGVSANAPGSGTPTGTVDFYDVTTKTDLGTVTLSAGSAVLSAGALPLGTQTITASYSGDGNFTASSVSLSEAVHYAFSGFLPPLSNGLSFGLNRTIPSKFQLTDANGNYITSPSAVTSLQVLNAQGTDVLANAGGTSLRYDPTANQFVANWRTKGLPAGSYQIVLTLADGSTHTQTIQLTSKGNGSNAQAADGSDVSAGSTAGQLLGGDLGVYVDNSNGELTPDELARIQDAVTAIDAVTEPYGVAVEETTDPTQAAVTLGMGTTSPVGGYPQGILGCFDPTASQVTLIQGWNWYAGADPTQVGSGQYDFQTTLTHELGHALGLGESADPTSAMFGTLAPATAIRTLTTADLNLSSDEAGADAQRAAAPAFTGAGPSPAVGPSSVAAVPSSSTPAGAAGPSGMSGFESLLLALLEAEALAMGGMTSGQSVAVSNGLFANLGDVLLIDVLLAEQAGATHA
jgi:hypothetical protein